MKDRYYVVCDEGFYSFSTLEEAREHINELAERLKYNEAQIREYIKIIKGSIMGLLVTATGYHIGITS